MANIEIFTYNGERDILKLHLSTTDSWVDKYIIVEANQTFTGKPKILYFFRDNRWFKKWWPKIDYYVVNNWEDENLWQKARQSPNTQGAEHWKREFYIKENIQKALKQTNVQDHDMLYIGDVDEIPRQYHESTKAKYPAKLKLDVYAYYLNNRSNEDFWGTYVAPYSYIKDKILNHERSRIDIRTKETNGWHFTSMGGLKEFRRKLNDSYTHESYNTEEVQQNLAQRHKECIDFLGRNFTFKISEEHWPEYLKQNKKLFKHLLLTKKEEYVARY